MKQEIAERWTDKLYELKERQCFGSLRKRKKMMAGPYGETCDCFCVLGALCDVAREDGLIEWYHPMWDCPEGRMSCRTIGHRGYDYYGTLPESVIEWAGIKETSVQLLLNQNDSQLKGFDQLAAFINKEWESL